MERELVGLVLTLATLIEEQGKQLDGLARRVERIDPAGRGRATR